MKFRVKTGFTLIEILVSISIIAILSSMAISTLSDARVKAQNVVAAAQLRDLEVAILRLANDTGEWPGHQAVEGVDSGGAGNEVWDMRADSAGLAGTDGLFPGWNGPYVSAASTTDPWGNPYFFDTDYDIGTSSTIWAAVVGSFGLNGVGQNVYDADNIIRVLVASSS